MNSFSSPHFKLLKAKILEQAGIVDIIPSDCRIISLKISHATQQVTSETTIKRIFGFALSKFNPSQYTVDVLAKYCGYTGWRNFCETEAVNVLSSAGMKVDTDWQNLKNEAGKITDFTLQALRNRSGIPFNQTISRSFFDNHMDDFKVSDYVGTIFAAPAGYGKTLALCHWVQKQQQLNYATGNDDILLFFSSHALMSVLHSGKNLMDWFLALLGYGGDTGVIGLKNLIQQQEHKFYLIIDGFDPFFLKKDDFNILMSQLCDILLLSKGLDFFRVVLTMRSATWINNRLEWEDEKYSWFNTLTNENDYINIPVLTPREVTELRNKINPADAGAISLKASQVVHHPLYFQYFYKLNKVDFSLKRVNSNTLFEILSAFISAKIYNSANSAETVSLIYALINELDFQQDAFHIDKLKVNSLIKQSSCTYHELLSIGILKEINSSSTTRYQNYIRFADPKILSHFIAQSIIEESGGVFDSEAINKINRLLKNGKDKLTVLKWCVLDAVKSGRFQDLQCLPAAGITTVQKAELITFISDLLKQEMTMYPAQSDLIKIFKGDAGDTIFNFFFGLEFICSEYKATLQTLLMFKLSPQQKIVVYTSLAIIAVIQLDMKELEHTLDQMSGMQVADYYSFPIDPLNCLDAIFHYFKFGFIKREALVELTKTAFAMGQSANAPFKKCAINDLLFILGIYTLWLADNPKKVIRFAKSIDRVYHNENLATGSNFAFFTSILKADAYFKLENKSQVKSWYDSICRVYESGDGSMTPYMKALFFSLKIKLFINKNTSNSILNDLKSVNTVAEDCGNKFSRVYILMILLKNDTFLSENPSFKKQAGYDYNMILTRSGIDRDCFQI
ncbi:hypothetical protein A0256_03530 [Mucilaginibacter sp. PAMC 26640]|nr:hypothetical protein A0256_03530 [Mucilaginibacter sp. PAMC 26640]